MPTEITEGIRIDVDVRFVPERSSVSRNLWFYAYTIRIGNEGVEPARLLTRSWKITNALGVVNEVHGPGVVGRTPHLDPGEVFEYTSGCPLDTSFGTMEGTYGMVRDDGRRFDVAIPCFLMSQPLALN